MKVLSKSVTLQTRVLCYLLGYRLVFVQFLFILLRLHHLTNNFKLCTYLTKELRCSRSNHWGGKDLEQRPRTGYHSCDWPPTRWTQNLVKVAGIPCIRVDIDLCGDIWGGLYLAVYISHILLFNKILTMLISFILIKCLQSSLQNYTRFTRGSKKVLAED